MRIPAANILRDLAILALTLVLWSWCRGHENQPNAMYNVVAVVTGLMTAVAGFLVHEWGHLTGAVIGRSVYAPPDSVFSLFLFRFNSDENNREQFLAMSNGGFVVSLLAVIFLFSVLSFHHLADQIALGLTTAGVIATFILEVPAAWKVYKGASIPRGAAYSGGDGA